MTALAMRRLMDAVLPITNAKESLVCFHCRYTAKADPDERHDRRCPTCQRPLVNCGKNFKTPAKLDDRGWRQAAALYAHKTDDMTEAVKAGKYYRVDIGTKDVNALRAMRHDIGKRFGKKAVAARDTVNVPDFDTVRRLVQKFPQSDVIEIDPTRIGIRRVYDRQLGWFPILSKDGGHYPNNEKNAEFGFTPHPAFRHIKAPTDLDQTPIDEGPFADRVKKGAQAAAIVGQLATAAGPALTPSAAPAQHVSQTQVQPDTPNPDYPARFVDGKWHYPRSPSQPSPPMKAPWALP